METEELQKSIRSVVKKFTDQITGQVSQAQKEGKEEPKLDPREIIQAVNDLAVTRPEDVNKPPAQLMKEAAERIRAKAKEAQENDGDPMFEALIGPVIDALVKEFIGKDLGPADACDPRKFLEAKHPEGDPAREAMLAEYDKILAKDPDLATPKTYARKDLVQLINECQFRIPLSVNLTAMKRKKEGKRTLEVPSDYTREQADKIFNEIAAVVRITCSRHRLLLKLLKTAKLPHALAVASPATIKAFIHALCELKDTCGAQIEAVETSE